MSHQMKAGAGKARIVFPHDMFPLEVMHVGVIFLMYNNLR